MLRVKEALYAGDFRLLLAFSDGTRKIADLKPYLTGEIFGELKDPQKFVQFGLTGYTIEWANGADLAPEFLHDIGVDVSQDTSFAAEEVPKYGASK